MDLPEDPLAPPAPQQFVTLRDRLVYLRSLPDLSDLPLDSLATFAQALEEHRAPRGTVLVAAGEPISHAYFLVEGAIGLYVDGEKVNAILPPRAVATIGIIAQISGPPGDIVADEDCLLLRIDARSLRSVQERDMRLMLGALRSIAQMVFEARGALPFDPKKPPKADPGTPPPRRLDFVDKLQWLHQSSAFSLASLDALGEMARNYTEVNFRAGETIWERGDPSGFTLLVMSGLIRCSSPEGSGHVGAEYSIGFLDGLAQLPRGYDAVAETDVVALRLELTAMFNVMEDQFDLASGALRALASIAVNHQWGQEFVLSSNLDART